ncbi:MAG TPA: carboxypeptidase-like regulatory domain-containing protein [Ramlibacter sp.]|nr:carboxypeptidase-like regulatory domain-containing protein [Ramlibacter sp.]
MNRALAGALTLCAALAVSSCGGGGSSDAPVPAIRSMPPLAAAAAIPAGVDATALMDAAERIYPSLFPGHQANQFYSPFVYRQYANGNDLGVAGDVIYIRGSVAGGSIPVSVGTLPQYTCMVLPQNCTTTGSRVSGTVIGKGTALSGALVTLHDIAGATRSTTTGAAGTYSLDVSNLAPPFVVTATGSDAGVATGLVSMGRLAGGLQDARVNLTPWTTALAAMLSPTGKAGDLDAARDRAAINGTLTAVITYTDTLLAPSLVDAGFTPAGFDPISSTLDANDGMATLLKNLTVGTTASKAIFMASSSAGPCSPAQLDGCVRYANPATQTVTSPNVCGSDIATGAPIACDASLPTSSAPQPIAITPSQAYAFGCIGCVFWGPADNYASLPTQTPIRIAAPTSSASSTWYAHFSVTFCSPGGDCFTSADSTQVTGFDAQATCLQGGQELAAILNSSPIDGLSYSFVCTQSP